MRRILPLVTAWAVLVPAGAAHAQTAISARAATVRFGGRLHSQYTASSVAEADNDVFFRRARLIADIRVSEVFDGRIQTDFAGGKAALQDAYVRLHLSPPFNVSVGQFKRGFDLFELSSSTNLSLIERDGRVEGVSSCDGVGGVCSYSRFTEKLGYAGRDQGVRVEAEQGRISFMGTITNGTGLNKADENDAKSYSGRLTLRSSDRVSFSAQLGLHDYPDGDANRYASAWGADVEIGGWRDGAHLQAAVAGGDNWKELDASGDPATFVAFQAVAGYYAPLSGSRFVGVEPLARVSFGDPDGNLTDDAGVVFTPGLMFYIAGRNKIGVNLDVYSPQTGDTDYSFKVQSFFYF